MIKPTLIFICLTVAFVFALSQTVFAQEASPSDHQQPAPSGRLPLTTPGASSEYVMVPKPMSIVQRRAQFEADQRLMRLEFYKQIGYSPLRPNMNGSYMSNGRIQYYLPQRGVIVNSSTTGSWWYW